MSAPHPIAPPLCLSVSLYPSVSLSISPSHLHLCDSQSFWLSIFTPLLTCLSSLCLSSSLCLRLSIAGGWCPVPTTVSRRKVHPGSGGKGSGLSPHQQPQLGRGSSVFTSQAQPCMENLPRTPPARLPDMLPLFLQMQEIAHNFKSRKQVRQLSEHSAHGGGPGMPLQVSLAPPGLRALKLGPQARSQDATGTGSKATAVFTVAAPVQSSWARLSVSTF